MSAAPAALLAPCRDPHCHTCDRAALAPIGDGGLADVIDLPLRQPRGVGMAAIYWRRRIVALAVVVVVALALGAGVNRLLAGPVQTPAAAGTAVLEPGDTLWDLAVEHTPTGGDVRATLRDIQTLNGFRTATVPVWTVVLLPATD